MRNIVATKGSVIVLGYEGENEATRICFPVVEKWRELYGENGTFTILMQRPTEDASYPKVTTVDGNKVCCVIDSADVSILGMGAVIVRYMVGDTIAKSEIYSTRIRGSIGAEGETPEPYQAWVDEVLSASANVDEAVERAETAQRSAEEAEQNAQTSAENAETSATNAETSATNASTSAASASTSATNAEASAVRAEEAAEGLNSLENRVDVLEKMSKGILYDFVTRTVEGYQSIPKGSHLADLQKLEGKSIVWNQLVSSMLEAQNQTPTNATLEKNTELAKITLLADITTTTEYFAYMSFNSAFRNGHKYYLSSYVNASRDCALRYDVFGSFYLVNQPITANIERKVSTIVIANTNRSAVSIYPNEKTSGFGIGDWYSLKNLMVIDLTQMFGAGNEPTIEQFEAMFPDAYYPYSTPMVISVDMNEIEVRSRNLWDEKWENGQWSAWSGTIVASPNATRIRSVNDIEVKPNTQYCSTAGKDIFVFYLDSNKNWINYADGGNGKYIPPNQSFTTPSNCKYLKFFTINTSTYNNDIAIVEGSSGIYTPHRDSIYIPLAFVGKSAGTVRDELDLVNKKYIQRVGVVDLGTLNWTYNTTYWPNPMFYSNLGIGTILDTRCKSDIPYNFVNNSLNDLESKDCAFYATGYLYVRDDSITNANDMKTSLVGKQLYYSLVEPIITDVSDVIDSFNVEGNGSIEFDSSIPVRNTIEYLRYLNEV